MSLSRACDQPTELHFALRQIIITFGKSSGMQFDELTACSCCSLNLNRIGCNEEADFDSRTDQAFAGLCQALQVCRDFQPTLGGYLLPSFRDKTDDVGLESQGDIQNLGRVGH